MVSGFFNKIGDNYGRFIPFLIVVPLGILTANFFSSRDTYQQILWLLVSIFLAASAVYGLRFIFFLLLPISIVSRGVFNLIGYLTIWDALLILVSGTVIITTLLKRRKLRLSRDGKVLVLLVFTIIGTQVIGFISFPELFLDVSFKPFLNLVEGALVSICVVSLIRKVNDIKILTRLILLAGLSLALITIYEAHFGTFFIGEQAIFSSTYSDYRRELKINPSSILLFLPAFYFTVLSTKKRPYMFILIFLFLYTFILSSSRSLYIGVLGGIIGILYLKRTSAGFLIISIATVLIAFTSDFIIPKVSEVTSSFSSYFSGSYPGGSSTTGRIIISKTALANFLNHPFWGYGINGFGMESYTDPHYMKRLGVMEEFGGFFTQFGAPAGDTHNQYLQILTDHGLIALALFLYLYFRLIKLAYRNCIKTVDPFLNNVSAALFVALVGLVFSFLGVPLLTSMASIISMTAFGVTVGLIFSIKRIIEKDERGFNKLNSNILRN